MSFKGNKSLLSTLNRLFILFILFIPDIVPASGTIPYISPGIRLGWNRGDGLFWGFKISMGINRDGNIYNITCGSKLFFNHKKNQQHNPFGFIELQAGQISDNFGDRHVPLFSGGGIGTGFVRHDDSITFAPRVTAFTGFGLFMVVDVNFIKQYGIKTNIGSEMVLPIPLKKAELGSIGG